MLIKFESTEHRTKDTIYTYINPDHVVEAKQHEQRIYLYLVDKEQKKFVATELNQEGFDRLVSVE